MDDQRIDRESGRSIERVSLRELLGVLTMAAIGMGVLFSVAKHPLSKAFALGFVLSAIVVYFYYRPKPK